MLAQSSICKADGLKAGAKTRATVKSSCFATNWMFSLYLSHKANGLARQTCEFGFSCSFSCNCKQTRKLGQSAAACLQLLFRFWLATQETCKLLAIAIYCWPVLSNKSSTNLIQISAKQANKQPLRKLGADRDELEHTCTSIVILLFLLLFLVAMVVCLVVVVVVVNLCE